MADKALDTSSGSNPPVVYFDKRRVMVKQSDERWWAIVGIPLSTSPGEHSIELDSAPAPALSRRIAFEIRDKAYETQRLTVTNKRQVNPNEEDLKRIKAERNRINVALSLWTSEREADTAFVAPLDGRRSSSFCQPSRISSRRWLCTVLRIVTTPVVRWRVSSVISSAG